MCEDPERYVLSTYANDSPRSKCRVSGGDGRKREWVFISETLETHWRILAHTSNFCLTQILSFFFSFLKAQVLNLTVCSAEHYLTHQGHATLSSSFVIYKKKARVAEIF